MAAEKLQCKSLCHLSGLLYLEATPKGLSTIYNCRDCHRSVTRAKYHNNQYQYLVSTGLWKPKTSRHPSKLILCSAWNLFMVTYLNLKAYINSKSLHSYLVFFHNCIRFSNTISFQDINMPNIYIYSFPVENYSTCFKWRMVYFCFNFFLIKWGKVYITLIQ